MMKRARDISFICCFLLLLVVPYAIKKLNIQVDTGNSEKRVLKPVPVAHFDSTIHASGPVNIYNAFIEDISTYKQQYDEYYTDNFRLKNNLFDVYVAVKHGLLRSSPIPANLMEGKDGWLFLGDSYCNIMLEYTALDVFTPQYVRDMKKYLQDNNAWLKERGIDFYVAVAPDKQNMYGQYLPLIKKARDNKFQQMKKADIDNAYPLVDLQEELVKHRELRLFHKTDTHWNEWGAFWGACKLMQRIAIDHPEVTIPSIKDYVVDSVVAWEMDLSGMLRLKIKEEQIVLKPLQPQYGVQVRSVLPVPEKYNTNPGKYEVRYKNPKQKLKIVVFRDSFSNAWIKFFKEHFGECIFIADYKIDHALIEREHPDIVICQAVQRDIDGWVNAPAE
jgi:alginate O-acetyltransferase complex protein AlgJ